MADGTTEALGISAMALRWFKVKEKYVRIQIVLGVWGGDEGWEVPGKLIKAKDLGGLKLLCGIGLKRNLGFTGLFPPPPPVSQQVISSAEPQHALVFPWVIIWGVRGILSTPG